MSEFKKITVSPGLPDNLSGLFDIADNLWFSWNHNAFNLFRRIENDLWRKYNHNPKKLLFKTGKDRFDKLSKDKDFLTSLESVLKEFKSYMNKGEGDKNSFKIVYFSAEYGLAESLPVYSGGLGILSGDHIKSASDLNLDLTGIGLLYQKGYFQQRLNRDGWQQDFYRVNDFKQMPIEEVKGKDGENLFIEIELQGEPLFLKVWKVRVGRISVYMLDSNIDQNNSGNRELTSQLYGGDKEFRLKQEIILGIGGFRLLEKIGLEPDVLHINEGHSAFAIFERARIIREKFSLDIEEAIELVKKSSVFTTHTPVAAGNDDFEPDLISRYFSDYSGKLGLSIRQFIDLGRSKEGTGKGNFSMTIAAIRHCSFVNGVSLLHGEVARKMWNHLWKDIHVECTPLDSVTNGVHLKTWVSEEMNSIFLKHLGNEWHIVKNKKDFEKNVNKISDKEIWETRKISKKKLVGFVREKIVEQHIRRGGGPEKIRELKSALDSDYLTIGFARRFASYKRGDLIFRDVERLIKLLKDKERPVRIIVAGKAHPQDVPGKEIIKNIIDLVNSRGLEKEVVFLENYDMNIAKNMIQGVDLWLNNPVRLMEASGTSGMKAVINGVLNFSILDGWWDEAFDGISGWSIGNRENIKRGDYRDELDMDSLYSTLENKIIPEFYNRNEHGIPVGWVERIRMGINTLAPVFNTYRMVSEYNERFYKRAGVGFKGLAENNYKGLKEFVLWKKYVGKRFNSVRINEIKYKNNIKSGENLKVEAEIKTGDMKPEELRVNVYYGEMDGNSGVVKPELFSLDKISSSGEGIFIFSGEVGCEVSGEVGFKIRVTPFHPSMIHQTELNLVKWG
ncbi:MAG: alpha-glucan family phosphorylase [Acidobacteriota bacterium]